MADSCKTAGLELSLNERIKILRKKSLNERIKILRKGKLCYGCLKPMAKDHNAKNCQQRLTCRICAACHPKILYGYVPKIKTDSSQSTENSECSSRITTGEENVTCASVNGNFYVEVISMCVVPVKIPHQN